MAQDCPCSGLTRPNCQEIPGIGRCSVLGRTRHLPPAICTQALKHSGRYRAGQNDYQNIVLNEVGKFRVRDNQRIAQAVYTFSHLPKHGGSRGISPQEVAILQQSHAKRCCWFLHCCHRHNRPHGHVHPQRQPTHVHPKKGHQEVAFPAFVFSDQSSLQPSACWLSIHDVCLAQADADVSCSFLSQCGPELCKAFPLLLKSAPLSCC